MTASSDHSPSASPGPARSTPPRRAGSIRRTTTHEGVRPHGLSGAVTIVARGRDLLTRADGEAVVLDTARVEIVAPFTGALERIVVEPAVPGIETLVGRSAYSGFRGAVAELMPGDRESGSVRHQLIDDLPTTLMLNGRALRVAGIGFGDRPSGLRSASGTCAGWAPGGTAMLQAPGDGPPLFPGSEAPIVETEDDPLGWHEHDMLPPLSTRRRRRLDLWYEDDRVQVDCFFRDSYIEDDGTETMVHEYTVRGAVDPSTLTIVSCDAEWGELPFPECPAAVSSAPRVIGEPLAGLRRKVLKTMVGTTTCTHLNDQLRSLEDVAPLVRALDAALGD